MFKVTLVVAHLGWVDHESGHSIVYPVLRVLRQMGICQNLLCSWRRWCNLPNRAGPGRVAIG